MIRRIYFLLPYYPKWFDGGIKYQTIVCDYFKRKYKNVNVFGRSVDVKKSKYRILNKLFKIIHVLRIAVAFMHIILIPRYSILILNNAFFLDYSLPLALNKFWKKHIYILIIHHLVQKDRPTYLRKKCENYFIKKANLLITVSNTSYADLKKLPLSLEPVPVVMPGLDVDIDKIPREKKFSEKAKLLYVGTVDVRKGLVYLIDALGKLKMKNFELNIVGRNNFDDYFVLLQNKIKDFNLEKNVFFRGRVEREQLINFYSKATIFVFPSLWEGYGMAVAEAMAYGLPIIASKIPALEELVEDGKEGILVEPKNSIQLSKGLERLLSDSRLLKEFSRNSLLKAKTFLSWDETSGKIWQLVNKNYTDK